MRILKSVGAVAVAAALVALPASAPGAAVQAAANEIAIVSSASFETGLLPRGSFMSIFTPLPVTDESGPFTPWATRTPGGVSVETDQCTERGDTWTRLPITYIGPSGLGTQINFYFPNPFGDEPYGTCDAWGVDTIRVVSKPGFAQLPPKDLDTTLALPAMFAAGSAPAGYHLDVVTQATTSFNDCAGNPGRCAVRTNGQANFLIMFTTGGEFWACPVPGHSCDAPKRLMFQLAPPGGGFVEAPLAFFGPAGYLGQEQGNVVIPESIPGGGAHRIKVTVPDADSARELTIWLGPPRILGP